MTSTEVNAFLTLDWSCVDRHIESSENLPPELIFDDTDRLINGALGKRIIACLRDGKERMTSQIAAIVGGRKIRRHLDYFESIGVLSCRIDPNRIHYNRGLWRMENESLLYQREPQARSSGKSEGVTKCRNI